MPPHPLTLPCGLVLPDRFAVAPLTNTQSHPDGTLADAELRWLLRRASGGWGLLSTCAAFVSEEGHAWRGQLGIADDTHLPGLGRLAAELRAAGAVAVVQLHHGGAKADLAPGLKLSAGDGEGIRAATRDDLDRVRGDFTAAALRAVEAGFAGVELHGANGYLFTQFLAPADNPREDGYGGDLAGRARLLRETLGAVRSAVPAGFAVGVRLSPVDLWDRRGIVLADTLQVARWLIEDGADWIHLSLRDAAQSAPHEPEAGPVARAFRDALPDAVPVLAAGGIWTRSDAQRAFDVGVDVAVLGRSAIIHPDWPRVAAVPGFEPTRPPWALDTLRAVDVGEAFISYLLRFPGLLEGGAPARR